MPATTEKPARTARTPEGLNVLTSGAEVGPAPTPGPVPVFVWIYDKGITAADSDPTEPSYALVVGRGFKDFPGKDKVPVVHVTKFVKATDQYRHGNMPVVSVRDVPVVESWTPVHPTVEKWPYPVFAVPART